MFMYSRSKFSFLRVSFSFVKLSKIFQEQFITSKNIQCEYWSQSGHKIPWPHMTWTLPDGFLSVMELLLVNTGWTEHWDLNWRGCLVWNPPCQNASGDSWWREEETEGRLPTLPAGLGTLPGGFVALITATATIWHGATYRSDAEICLLAVRKAGANKVGCASSNASRASSCRAEPLRSLVCHYSVSMWVISSLPYTLAGAQTHVLSFFFASQLLPSLFFSVFKNEAFGSSSLQASLQLVWNSFLFPMLR